MSEDICRNRVVLYEGTVRADKRTKDQDKQQGRFCLLEKSETVKCTKSPLPDYRMETGAGSKRPNVSLYSVRDLDDARET